MDTMNTEQFQELQRLASDDSPLLDDYSVEACAAAVKELAQVRAAAAAYVRSYAQPGLLADEDGGPLFSMMEG